MVGFVNDRFVNDDLKDRFVLQCMVESYKQTLYKMYHVAWKTCSLRY